MTGKKEYFGLSAGLVSISFAAIFIKLADAPPSVVSALRMIFSTILILPFAILSKDLKKEVRILTSRDIALLFFSGVLLSLHFLSWITSLSLTGVTSSIVFVSASPLFVALYTVTALKEKISRSFWVGLCIATTGTLIMAGGNIFAGGNSWKGDLLAVAGAVSAAGYFLVGSRLRTRISLITYIFPVYLTAAVILTLAVPICGDKFTGLPFISYSYCFLMAIVCQLAGHTVFNWALKRVKAAIVTLTILGEPIGTTILAYFILEEIPATTEIAGGAFILGGILAVLHKNPKIAASQKRIVDIS